ncbi:MAG: dihydroorotate dehydrogenase [Lachnospiraceae bacterium]|nr:dihydroorotate dehydrogenase [Lachnospiraceae bacterium]
MSNNTNVSMKVNFAGVEMKNPVTVASGTFGSGMEFYEFTDLNKLGAVTTKGVAIVPWAGNPTPRVVETASGMLNAIGLQNPGADVFIERDLKFLEEYDTNIIANLCGHSEDEYLAIVEKMNETSVQMFEINISCPNVKSGGIAFGTDPKMVEQITGKIKAIAKKPVIMKLSPNVTSISEMAKAAEAGGADAISLINTLTGMKIDIYRKSFALANKTGGLSGPAIKPVALRMVYEASHAVNIPVLGMGGIACAEDAIEFMMAGATMVSVGTMNFHNPHITGEIIKGIEDYLISQKINDINEIIGIL